MKTTAFVFPFDLFGSGGAGQGARLLGDALREMLDDNRREKQSTRARAYTRKVEIREYDFETLSAYDDWRGRARKAVRRAWRAGNFLLWITGNHLGALPVYDELAGRNDTLVVQFDAHLDVYNLSDCTKAPSHGNFLLHSTSPLPPLINVGHRELLLRPEYVSRFYEAAHPAAELAIDPAPALRRLRERCAAAPRVFLDLDCDVFDPSCFPAVSHALPFGLGPETFLRCLDAAWSKRVTGMSISEFDPGRDRNDQALGTLVWLIEYLLLRKYEARPSPRSIATKRHQER